MNRRQYKGFHMNPTRRQQHYNRLDDDNESQAFIEVYSNHRSTYQNNYSNQSHSRWDQSGRGSNQSQKSPHASSINHDSKKNSTVTPSTTHTSSTPKKVDKNQPSQDQISSAARSATVTSQAQVNGKHPDMPWIDLPNKSPRGAELSIYSVTKQQNGTSTTWSSKTTEVGISQHQQPVQPNTLPNNSQASSIKTSTSTVSQRGLNESQNTSVQERQSLSASHGQQLQASQLSSRASETRDDCQLNTPQRPTPKKRASSNTSQASGSNSSPKNYNIMANGGQKAEIPQKDSLAFQSMVEVLRCNGCHRWMSGVTIQSCHCRFICAECATTLTECSSCGLFPTEEKRVSLLYQRMFAAIPHPCKYEVHGCTHTVVPGDLHEQACDYYPLNCFLCSQAVPMINFQQHFKGDHPDLKPLTGHNVGVKVSDFWAHPDTGKPCVFCFHQDQVVQIMMIKNEPQNASFVMQRILPLDDTITVSMIFEFKLNCYCWQRTETLSPIKLSYLELPREVLADWIEGNCSLELSVSVKKKRKAKANSVFRAKKHKTQNQR